MSKVMVRVVTVLVGDQVRCMVPVPPVAQRKRARSADPSVVWPTRVMVSVGGFSRYAVAIASRPSNGPAGTLTKVMAASSAKRSAKVVQSPVVTA